MANTIGRNFGQLLQLGMQYGLPAIGGIQGIMGNQVLQQIAQERLNRMRQENATNGLVGQSAVASPAVSVNSPLYQPLGASGQNPASLGFTEYGGLVG